MRISPESEKIIAAVGETGSVSKAAGRLGISQPAVSNRLRKIEATLGVKIFDRSHHPYARTPEGDLVWEYLKERRRLDDKLQAELTALDSMERGSVRVGGASAFNMVYLPKTISRFAEKYPNIRIQIVDASVPELVRQTLDGELDLFITSPFGSSEGIALERLLSTQIYLCVPRQAKINAKLRVCEIPFDEIDRRDTYPEITLADLDDVPLIRLAPERNLGQMLDTLRKLEHHTAPIRIQADQAVTAYMMTVGGVGACLMSGIDILNLPVSPKPRYYMVNAQICRRDMYLATPQGHTLSAAAKAFVSEIRHTTLEMK